MRKNERWTKGNKSRTAENKEEKGENEGVRKMRKGNGRQKNEENGTEKSEKAKTGRKLVWVPPSLPPPHPCP